MTLQDFSRQCIFGPSLCAFAEEALRTSPDHYATNPYTSLMSNSGLFNFQIFKYIKSLELFNKRYPSDPAVFKTGSIYENTGPFAIGNVLFLPAIECLGSPEQYAHYSKLLLAGKIIGSRAQPEIGHDSDTQSLQPTATFDPIKKCFVLNSPSTKTIRFWASALGASATHTIVQARLIINNKSYGVQTFVIQIRDPKTLETMPGLNIDDIGPKLGLRHIDNGYLEFKNYEVPLDGLLSRYIQLDAEGNVTLSQDKKAMKLMYGTAMMVLRGSLFRYFTLNISKCIQMAYAYEKEQISPLETRRDLDVMTNYWTFVLSSSYMRELFEEFSLSYHKDAGKALGMLREIHFTSAGLKVLSSWEAVKVAREKSSKLGTGAQVLNGVVLCYGDAVSTTDLEGDNMAMLLQITKAALAYYKDLASGKRIEGVMSFLNKYEQYATNDVGFKEAIEVKDADELNEQLSTVLQNFCFKALQVLAQRVKKAVLEDGLSVEAVINGKMQTESVKVGLQLFEFVNVDTALRVYYEKKTQKALNVYDYVILGNFVHLHQVNYLKDKLSAVLASGVLKYNENIENYIDLLQRRLHFYLEIEAEYIYQNLLVSKPELHSVRDFKNISNKEYFDMRNKGIEILKSIGSSLKNSKL